MGSIVINTHLSSVNIHEDSGVASRITGYGNITMNIFTLSGSGERGGHS